MNTQQKLEQLAFGIATSQFISGDNGFEGTWFDRYQFLSDCVVKNKEPEDWIAWQPFEDFEWSDILSHIENEASSVLRTLKHVLEQTKKGLIQSAIDCTLVSDFNDLDMQNMFEIGSHAE